MDLRRLRAGEWIAAISGLVLLVSLFLSWYGRGAAASGLSAWEALAVNDVVLAFVGAFGLLVLAVTAWQQAPALPLALDGFATLLGFLAIVLVLIRIAWLPDLAEGREIGVWLALASAVGVAAGAWLAMRDERLSEPGSSTDSTGRPTSTSPEVEAFPAPRT